VNPENGHPDPERLAPESALVNDTILASARAQAAMHHSTVLSALQSICAAPAAAVMAALARHFRMDALDDDGLRAITPDFDVIALRDCMRAGVLFGCTPEGRPRIVLSDPFDAHTEAWALRRAQARGWLACPLLASAETLHTYLEAHAGDLRALDAFRSDDAPHGGDDAVTDISLAMLEDADGQVVRLVNSVLHDALQLGASDIHLECDAHSLHVQYRMDGVLVSMTRFNGSALAEQVISRIKVLADLDIAERRIPQDGRFKARVHSRVIDLRVSIMPNLFGEDAVLRLLDRRALVEECSALTLDRLGLDSECVTSVRELAARAHGMLLATGPTGSGKTTTLYAAITEIHTGRDKIITIEDPIEYRLPGVLQIPVNEKKGLSFARGLRSILRHDPDKIMVGEIRDNDTAAIAVQAALTGHLVFTSVHANNVFDVLGRFLHMGVDAYSFAAALNGIVAQRLMRLNCEACRRPVALDVERVHKGAVAHGDLGAWTPMAGAGCSHCRQTGFKGRAAIAEVLRIDDSLRAMITRRAPAAEMREYAATRGWVSLESLAWRRVAAGITTVDEVLRVVG